MVLNAFHRDPTSVLLDDLTDAGETDAGSFDSPGHVACAEEAIEHPRDIARWDTDAPILNLDQGPFDAINLFAAEPNDHFASFGRVLNCVRQQIHHNPLDPLAVPGAGQSRHPALN